MNNTVSNQLISLASREVDMAEDNNWFEYVSNQLISLASRERLESGKYITGTEKGVPNQLISLASREF